MVISQTNDPVHQKVENCNEVLRASLPDLSFIVTHFLCGKAGEPGAIRRSSISSRKVADPAQGDSLSDKDTLDDLAQAHIREFDREGIFLSIIEDWASRSGAQEKLILNVQKDANLTGVTLRFKTLKREGFGWASLTLSDSLVDELCPPDSAKKYLNRLNDGVEKDIQDYKSYLALRKAAAFGKLKSDITNEKDAYKFVGDASALSDQNKYEDALWRLLGGLQSALLYFSASEASSLRSLNNGATILVRRGRTYTKRREDGSTRRAVEMMVALLYPYSSHDVDMIFTVLGNSLQPINELLTSRDINITDMSFIRFHANEQNSRKKLKEFVEDIFVIPVQKETASRLTLWLTWMVQELQGKKHEGHRLDFWFVVGDRIQFEDSRSTLSRSFSELESILREDFGKAVEPLKVPPSSSDEETAKIVMQRVVKFLSGEHYPWFQGGKYALFWDVTTITQGPNAHMLPYGLMSIPGNTWEQYQMQHYTRTCHINLPANILIYTKSSPTDSGLLITSSENNLTKRVLNLRDGEWRLTDDDERRLHLKDDILNKSIIESLALRDEIIETTLRIADNPAQGGTLIILKKARSNVSKNPTHFTKMGIPWKFSNNPQDIEALIGHDGATVIQENGSRGVEWSFRLLLSADDVSPGVRKDLQEMAHDISLEFPLSGAGSRRWSSALAAFRNDVQAVIVISQDGDIGCWVAPSKVVRKGARSKSIENATLHILRQGEKPKSVKLSEYKKRLGDAAKVVASP